MNVAKELMEIPDFGDDDSTLFAKEKKALNNLKKATLMVAGAAVQKFMMTLAKEQEILMNIADMASLVYIAESAILRAEKMVQKTGEEQNALQIDMARVYLHEALDKSYLQGKEAINAFAEGDEQRMMLMGLRRFTKIEPLNLKDARQRIAQKLIKENKYCF